MAYDFNKMSRGEREQFEEVLHRIPVTLTIAAITEEEAKKGADVLVHLLNQVVKEAADEGSFLDVLWEPIEMKVAEDA